MFLPARFKYTFYHVLEWYYPILTVAHKCHGERQSHNESQSNDESQSHAGDESKCHDKSQSHNESQSHDIRQRHDDYAVVSNLSTLFIREWLSLSSWL